MSYLESLYNKYGIIFKAGYIIILLLYVTALIFIALGDVIVSDYDTAFYWFNELFNAAVNTQNVILFAVIILLLVEEKDCSDM